MNQPKKIRYKYRIKYSKGPELRFVSHLDLMRLFQRAVRRAGLPIGYSHGFNPHQLMSFGNPLSLGMTSIGEYCDFEFETPVEPREIAERLGAVMTRRRGDNKCGKAFPAGKIGHGGNFAPASMRRI